MFTTFPSSCASPAEASRKPEEERFTSGEDRMFQLARSVRWMFGRRPPRSRTLRRTRVSKKSHHATPQQRGTAAFALLQHKHLRLSSLDNLDGKTVCVLDDYMTTGNAFDIARNMLAAAGVKCVIFVAVGAFRDQYHRVDRTLANVDSDDAMTEGAAATNDTMLSHHILVERQVQMEHVRQSHQSRTARG